VHKVSNVEAHRHASIQKAASDLSHSFSIGKMKHNTN
jgi:hypothetical protein